MLYDKKSLTVQTVHTAFDTWDQTDSVHGPDRGPFGLDRTVNNPTVKQYYQYK
jgi:hypothetical protein